MASLVPFLLLELARREFPDLMRRRANRDDTIQTLALVEHATGGKGAAKAARRALSWLEYELGVVLDRPKCRKPWFYPGVSDAVAMRRVRAA